MIGIVVVSRGGTVISRGWGMKCIFTVVIGDGDERRSSGGGGGGGGGNKLCGGLVVGGLVVGSLVVGGWWWWSKRLTAHPAATEKSEMSKVGEMQATRRRDR